MKRPALQEQARRLGLLNVLFLPYQPKERLGEVFEASGFGLKRAFDAALAGVGLIVSVPLWILIALGIKLEDGGPVFYAQERVGKGGRRFKSWKFRSTVPDADERFGPLQADEDDQRVTKIGRLLRATGLDELPQLWNILKGDMSFVGPRALLPAEIEVNGTGEPLPLEMIPGYEARHRVRPGLMGLAQVYASRDLLRRHKFKCKRSGGRSETRFLDPVSGSEIGSTSSCSWTWCNAFATSSNPPA